jgi:hypothetical protein
VKCDVGLYNNIWSDGFGICRACPEGAQCWPNGDYYPVNLAGYYPVDLFVYMPCIPVEACPAGKQAISSSNLTLEAYSSAFLNANSSQMQFPCADGYTSVRCGQCARGYYRKGSSCAACPNYNLTPALIALIIFVVLVLLLVAVNLLRKIDIGFIGILFSYWQMVAILQTFNLNWPAIVTGTLHYLSFIYFNIELTSPECYVADDNSRTYELKWYATVAQPVAVVAVIGILLWLNAIRLALMDFYVGYKKAMEGQTGQLKKKPSRESTASMKETDGKIKKSALLDPEMVSEILRISN